MPGEGNKAMRRKEEDVASKEKKSQCVFTQVCLCIFVFACY